MFSQAVTQEMEKRIALKVGQGMSRKLAAAKLLESKEPWYVQTPEGEYLLRIISPRDSRLWSSA